MSNFLRFRNPRVQISCCCTSFFFIISLFYIVPGLIDYQRYEKNVESTCTINSWDIKSRDCTLTQCSIGGTSCISIRTICYTCRYSVIFNSIENVPLVATTDYDGDFGTVNEARQYCAKRTIESPIPCYYQPLQPRGNRFYVSLVAPTTNTYFAPIILFSVVCIIMCLHTCYSQCKSAPSDIGLERIYALARERAIDANMRALRWSDYYTDEPDPFMDPQRNLTGSGPRNTTRNPMNFSSSTSTILTNTSTSNNDIWNSATSTAILNSNTNQHIHGRYGNNIHSDIDTDDIVVARNPMHHNNYR